MSIVHIVNRQLLKTLASEEDDRTLHTEPVYQGEQDDQSQPLPIKVLDLLIKKGMTTQTSDRYNPAIKSTFSSSILNRIRNEQFRLKTLSEFRIRKDKRSPEPKTAITRKSLFISNKIVYPTFQKALNVQSPEDEAVEAPKLEKLDLQTINHELRSYQSRRYTRIGKIFDKKYSKQWKRQYLC